MLDCYVDLKAWSWIHMIWCLHLTSFGFRIIYYVLEWIYVYTFRWSIRSSAAMLNSEVEDWIWTLESSCVQALILQLLQLMMLRRHFSLSGMPYEAMLQAWPDFFGSVELSYEAMRHTNNQSKRFIAKTITFNFKVLRCRKFCVLLYIKGYFRIVINICAQVATPQVCGVFLHDFVGNETELRRPRCMQLVAWPNLRRTVRWMHDKAIFAIYENCHSCHCFFWVTVVLPKPSTMCHGFESGAEVRRHHKDHQAKPWQLSSFVHSELYYGQAAAQAIPKCKRQVFKLCLYSCTHARQVMKKQRLHRGHLCLKLWLEFQKKAMSWKYMRKGSTKRFVAVSLGRTFGAFTGKNWFQLLRKAGTRMQRGGLRGTCIELHIIIYLFSTAFSIFQFQFKCFEIYSFHLKRRSR